MATKTEEYIEKAINKAIDKLPRNSISNCSIHMDMKADGATKLLAEAMKEQAIANRSLCEAMESLSKTLKPIDVCAIKMTQ